MEEFSDKYCTGSIIVFDDYPHIIKNMRYGKGKCTCCNKILITSYNIMMHKTEEHLYRIANKSNVPTPTVHGDLKLYEILCVDDENITLFDNCEQIVKEISIENCVDVDLGLDDCFYLCRESGKIRKMVSNVVVDVEDLKLIACTVDVGFVSCIVKICLF